MKKLWQTSPEENRNTFVDRFTVGDDYSQDNFLLATDVKASKAHANMLESKGILTKEENTMLQSALDEILELFQKGIFVIKPDHEDCHTAIEEFLTEKCGSAGKKIHTGRSRNDQVLVALRLVLQEKTKVLKEKYEDLAESFSLAAKKWKNQEMPGYTHAQKAMPTTVGVWLSGFADALSDQLPALETYQKIIDQNPLGSASGFGIRNFEPDRRMTTKELGFLKVQENPIYCGLSRGLFELQLANTISPGILICSRFIADILFFTADGRQYFSLPDFLTTGSSIMPQKKNVDPAEIFRGKVSRFLALKNEMEMIYNGLLSGYNRDISLIKETLFRTLFLAEELFEMAKIFAENITPNKDALQKSMTADLFATEKVYELVKQGMPFREAYRKVKAEYFDNEKEF